MQSQIKCLRRRSASYHVAGSQSASRKSRKRSGWSVLCTTTWGSLITRQVASNVPQTRSVPNCYPCLRKKMGTDRPVRTQKLVVGVTGFEPATPTSRIQASTSKDFQRVNKNNNIVKISSRDGQLNLLTSARN